MSFTVIDAPQRSPAWFAARLGRLTASNAKHIAAFLKNGDEAAARRDLKMQLVCERLTGQPQEDAYTNADMQRGIDLEPAAFAAYEAETGSLVDRVGFLAHDTLMAGGSPDGVIGGYRGLVELKCPRPANHVRYLRTSGIPSEHRTQLTHLLWLTGAQWIDFVSYCPVLPERMRVCVQRLTYSEADIEAHDKAVRTFLADVDNELAALKGWSILEEQGYGI